MLKDFYIITFYCTRFQMFSIYNIDEKPSVLRCWMHIVQHKETRKTSTKAAHYPHIESLDPDSDLNHPTI